MRGIGLLLRGVPMGGGNPHALLMSWQPTTYLRYNEASGPAINWGSDGVNGTGTVSGCTQAQTGQLGAGEAVSFDGVDDVITFANAAVPSTKALTTRRAVFLCKPTSLGEGNAGAFFYWQTTLTYFRLRANNSLIAVIKSDGTSATAATNDNQISSIVNAWTCVFMDYDDTGTRKIRLWKGQGGTVTPLTLATDIALTGTVTPCTGNLYLGNEAGGTWTFAGLRDVDMIGAGLWTPADMQRIVTLVGV